MPTPSERSQIASIAANESWARTPDRAARTAAARAALMASFEQEVDPEGRLSSAERARRAESLRKAHFQRLALKSAQSRRKSKALAAQADAADVEIADLGGEPGAA